MSREPDAFHMLSKAAKLEGLKDARAACVQQQQDFLSPEYATQQPLSSFNERFACGECIKAIDALIAQTESTQ